MKKIWVGGALLALLLMVKDPGLVNSGNPEQKDETKPALQVPKGGASCGFLPVTVPGGQGGRDIYVVPEEVIAVYANNAQNTSTTIVFRHNGSKQVNAPDTKVLKALQSLKRVHPDDK